MGVFAVQVISSPRLTNVPAFIKRKYNIAITVLHVILVNMYFASGNVQMNKICSTAFLLRIELIFFKFAVLFLFLQEY